jgi:nitrate reductase NapAB chaperone NapD
MFRVMLCVIVGAFSFSLHKHGLCSAQKLNHRPYKIILVVDSENTSMLKNWLHYYAKLNNILELNCSLTGYPYLDVHTTSLQTQATLLKENIPSTYARDFIKESYENGLLTTKFQSNKTKSTNNAKLVSQQLGILWKYRIQVALRHLRNGTDVIMSDLDAVWLKNPVPWVQEPVSAENTGMGGKMNRVRSKCPSKATRTHLVTAAWENTNQTTGIDRVYAEVVASRAWFPWPLQRHWGATACMGFIYLRAGPFTVELLGTMFETAKAYHKRTLLSALNTSLQTNSTEMFSAIRRFNKTKSILQYNLSQHTITLRNASGLNKATHVQSIVKAMVHLDSALHNTDDQVALNFQLYHWGLNFPRRLRVANSNSTKPDVGVVIRHHHKHYVTFLPHLYFARKCPSVPIRHEIGSFARPINRNSINDTAVYSTSMAGTDDQVGCHNFSTVSCSENNSSNHTISSINTAISLNETRVVASIVTALEQATKWNNFGIVVAHCRFALGTAVQKEKTLEARGLWKN